MRTHGVGRKQEKMFFFEKKNQKTFASLSRTHHQHAPEDVKVFCFFFSKKKAFPRPISTSP
jgi:hypothetical protein